MSSKNSQAELHPSLPYAVLGIVLVLVAEQFTNIDLLLQDQLYDPGQGWRIDPNAALPRFWFYRLPKVLLWLVGLLPLLLALGPARWRERWGLGRRDLLVFFSAMALIPLSVGIGKALTRVHCPCELARYGGKVAYVKIFSSYAPEDRPERPGRCFPAAQASGGFALMGLLAIRRLRHRHRVAFLVGSTVGFLLGFYQMARGAHFLSHTLVSWLWAWIVALLLDHFWPRQNQEAAEPPLPDGDELRA